MASKRTVLSQTERAFWRDAFRAAAHGTAHPRQRSAARAAQYCEDFADLAVEKLRQRTAAWSRQ